MSDTQAHEVEVAAPQLEVAPGPHLSRAGLSTRRMMADVLIALAPATLMAIYIFREYAILQIGVCVLSCVFAEWLFEHRMRGHSGRLGDLSATVTGLILALTLPWSAPWYVGVIGSFAAIGLGKTIFGGLGMNLFNPAMVGRAFVMISFSAALGSGAYMAEGGSLEILTQATPLAAAKGGAPLESLWPLFLGTVNGSLGETSALACLLGGVYLVARRAATWEVPALVIAGTVLFGGLAQLTGVSPEITVLEHLFGGSLFFGAFFIATDPVSSPVAFKGRMLFALGVAFFIVLIRLFSGYPEGVMFAVLLMNGVTPLLNNWTVPKPFGGPVPQPKA